MLSLFSQTQLHAAASLPTTVRELVQSSEPAQADGDTVMTEAAQASAPVVPEPARTATINLKSGQLSFVGRRSSEFSKTKTRDRRARSTARDHQHGAAEPHQQPLKTCMRPGCDEPVPASQGASMNWAPYCGQEHAELAKALASSQAASVKPAPMEAAEQPGKGASRRKGMPRFTSRRSAAPLPLTKPRVDQYQNLSHSQNQEVMQQRAVEFAKLKANNDMMQVLDADDEHRKLTAEYAVGVQQLAAARPEDPLVQQQVRALEQHQSLAAASAQSIEPAFEATSHGFGATVQKHVAGFPDTSETAKSMDLTETPNPASDQAPASAPASASSPSGQTEQAAAQSAREPPSAPVQLETIDLSRWTLHASAV